MTEPHAIFLINLLQDVNIVRPLVFMAARDLCLQTEFLVSSKFAERDSNDAWQTELDEMSRILGARQTRFDSPLNALESLAGKHGVLVAASESSLPEHAVTSDVFRVAPPALVKVTLQHGFECVGFLQSHEHDLAHGAAVTFRADIVCGWCDEARLSSLQPSQRSKLVVTGPSGLLQMRRRAPGDPDAPDMGLICENLHSVRQHVSGNFKADFMDTFNAFCVELATSHRRVTLRPHPGGQYVVNSNVTVPANVVLNNNPMYKVDLTQYAYGISPPSSVLLDMVLAGIPAAIWRDGGSILDTGNYPGLAEVSSVSEWVDFSKEAVAHPERFLERQASFLDMQQMPTDPQDVYRRYARVLKSAAAASALPAVRTRSAERILFVAGTGEPMIQSKFLDSLGPLIADGGIETSTLDAADLDRIADRAGGAMLEPWLERRLLDFDPTLIVFCSSAASFAEKVQPLARLRRIATMLYLTDEPKQSIATGKGARKAAQRGSEAASALRLLADSVDLIFCATPDLSTWYRDQGVRTPILIETREATDSAAVAPDTSLQQILGAFAHARAAKPKRRRVLVVSSPGNAARDTGFIEALKPWIDAGDIAAEILLAPGKGAGDWMEAAVERFKPDLIVVSGYDGADAALIADAADRHQTPILYHAGHDAPLAYASVDQPSGAKRSEARRLKAVRILLDRATLVYCPTPRLKKLLAVAGAKAPLRSASIARAADVLAPAEDRPVRTIGCIADVGDSDGVDLILPAIVSFLRNHADVGFEMIGSLPKPSALEEFGDRAVKVGTAREGRLALLVQRRWQIGLCPLTASDLNLARSNALWVDLTAAGTAVIASRGTVYDDCCADGCGMLARRSPEWLAALETLFRQPAERTAQVMRAQMRLATEFQPRQLRDQIVTVFNAVHALATVGAIPVA